MRASVPNTQDGPEGSAPPAGERRWEKKYRKNTIYYIIKKKIKLHTYILKIC